MGTTLSRPAPDLSPLRDTHAGIVVGPADPGWDEARAAWNLMADQRPAAVAFPESADDVAAAVDFARAAGLRVAMQGTGHTPLALGDLAGTLLVRTNAMGGVQVDPVARVARAEAGAIWEAVVDAAAPHGLAALHGSSPDVGVVGYTLGGGIGWLAREHGLACNAVMAVELVTADGRQVRADAHTEPDLFWALRGGGGSFGAVTAIELALVPVAEVYAGWLVWPWERAQEVLGAWSAWTESAPEQVTSIGRLLQLPPLPVIPEPLRGRNLVVVEAVCLGGADAGVELMAPLRALEPEIDTFATIPAPALVRMHQDPEGPTPGIGTHAMLDTVAGETLAALLAAAGPGSGSSLLSVEIRHLGGALGRPAAGAGALSHLEAGFLVFGVGLPMAPGMAETIQADADGLVAALAPWGSGRSYLNFAEVPTDTRTAFTATAHARLAAVRRRVDPDGLFHANHPIGS